MTIGQTLRTSGDLTKDLGKVVEFLKDVEPDYLPKDVITDLWDAACRILLVVNKKKIPREELAQYLNALPTVKKGEEKLNKWKRCPCCGESYNKINCLTPSIYSL